MTEMDNVSLKVIEDARGVRNDNIREAEEKARAILEEAATKVKEKAAQAKAAADEHYRNTYDMEVFKARSALEQKVLLVKLELVEEVIETAKDRLAGLDSRGWRKFLKKMAALLDISKGQYTIGRLETVLDDSIASTIKGIKPDRQKADFDRGLKISGGNSEILLSPESYLDMDIEDLKMEVAAYLFSGGQ